MKWNSAVNRWEFCQTCGEEARGYCLCSGLVPTAPDRAYALRQDAACLAVLPGRDADVRRLHDAADQLDPPRASNQADGFAHDE